MRTPIPEKIRQKVIELWLSGDGRDIIARKAGISHGSVVNIVNKWKEDVGKLEAEALREYGKSIRNSGLPLVLNLAGTRISNILKKIGYDPEADNIERFFSDTYEKCMSRGFTPEMIASHIEDLTKVPGDVRLPELEKNRTTMVAEITSLREQKQGLIDDISTIKQQKSEAERDLDRSLGKKRMIEDELKDYYDTKQQLGIYGLNMTDFQKTAKTIRTTKELGYDPTTIVEGIQDVRYYNQNMKALTAELDDKTIKIQAAECRHCQLQDAIHLYSQRLAAYEWFERHGVSGSDLRILFDKILDISLYYRVPFHVAFNKFFGDVNGQYGPKLGFESKIESLKSEVDRLSKERKEEEKKMNNASQSVFNILFGNQPIDLPMTEAKY